MNEMQKYQASYRRIMTSDYTSPAIELAKKVHLKAIMVRDAHPLFEPYKDFHDYLMAIADEIENLPMEKQKLHKEVFE